MPSSNLPTNFRAEEIKEKQLIAKKTQVYRSEG